MHTPTFRSPRPRPLFAALALLASAGSVACARHVHLVVPSTTGAQSYVCRRGAGCVNNRVVDPTLARQSHTERVELPAECQGRIHSILVRNADSGDPEIIATCAPREDPIPTVGGTR